MFGKIFFTGLKPSFKDFIKMIINSYNICKSSKILCNICLISLTIIFINGCSSTKDVISNWKNEETKVDGDIKEWQNNLTDIKDYNASIGFQNDDKYLYMCLIVNEPFQAIQIFRNGFIIWFIPKDNSKTFGLKFPLGSSEINFNRDETLNRWRERAFNSENTNHEERFNVEKMLEKYLEKERNFEIIDKSKYPLWMYPLENDKGIKPKISINSNKLIYELQIPISDNKEYDFKIPVSTGESITVRLETEKANQEDSGKRSWKSEDGRFQRPAGLPPRRIANSFNREQLSFSINLTLEKQK